MPRVCTKCDRVVAEAAYCPFCSEPTIEYVPVPVHRSEGSEVRTIITEFQRRNNRWMALIPIIIAPVWALSALVRIRALGGFAPILGPACFVMLGAVLFILLSVWLSACPCPRCEKNLPHLTGRNIRYCPFCGVDLAIEIYPESHEVKKLLASISGQSEPEIEAMNVQLPPGKERANTDIQLPFGKEDKGTAK